MFKKLMLPLLAAVSLTGCMGHNGLSEKIVRFNLTAAEGPWSREFLFLGLNITLVYPVCAVLDLLVFNSIEFWSGENPLNGKSPLVDVPMDMVQQMGFEGIDSAKIERLCDTKAKMYLDFANGDSATFDVVRNDMSYTVSYRGVEFYKGEIQ